MIFCLTLRYKNYLHAVWFGSFFKRKLREHRLLSQTDCVVSLSIESLIFDTVEVSQPRQNNIDETVHKLVHFFLNNIRFRTQRARK